MRLRHVGAGWGRAAAAALLDALLPAQCLTCDQPVGAPGQFCPACFGQMEFIAAPCCAACGLPFAATAMAGPDTRCLTCEVMPPPWSQARAAMMYNDRAKRLLLPFKHGDRTEHARAVAALMARAGAALLARADLIVPVPLHRWRLLSRRYNQSALLAAALARRSGRIAVLDALIRTRRTPSLGPLSRSRRAQALRGAIVANARRLPMLRDARVLLVDDVLTTGATAGACTRALLAAGAGAVDVLAAARVADPQPDGPPWQALPSERSWDT